MAAGGVGEREEEESAEDLTPVVKVLVATDVNELVVSLWKQLKSGS